MSKPNVSFNEAWSQSSELFNESEFGDDMESDDVHEGMVNELLEEWGFDPKSKEVEEFRELMVDAGRQNYHAEYASNAPGSRSGHRDEYKKYSACAKNRLRVLFGRKPKGVEETQEVKNFLETQGHLLTTQYSQYHEGGKIVSEEIKKKFGFTKGMSQDLTGVCENIFGFGKGKGDPDRSWNTNILEYAGIKLVSIRKKV